MRPSTTQIGCRAASRDSPTIAMSRLVFGTPPPGLALTSRANVAVGKHELGVQNGRTRCAPDRVVAEHDKLYVE